MSDLDRTDFELAVTQAARRLAYPPTPDLAGRAALPRTSALAPARLRWAWAVGLAALALAALLLAAPPVRAALVEFLQIGVIRIFGGPPTAETTAPTPAREPDAVPWQVAPPPTAIAPLALDALAGETTLDEALRAAPFRVRLPAALGTPDRVFVQGVGGGTAVTLAWLDEAGLARAVMQQLGPGALVWKMEPARVAETTVNGQPALWVSGPYVVVLKNGSSDIRHLVAGHALLWEEDGVTYRLETALPLEEAIALAESLAR